jgi:hypothetical protein
MRLKRLGSSFSMKTALDWEFGSENHGILSANSASAIQGSGAVDSAHRAKFRAEGNFIERNQKL